MSRRSIINDIDKYLAIVRNNSTFVVSGLPKYAKLLEAARCQLAEDQFREITARGILTDMPQWNFARTDAAVNLARDGVDFTTDGVHPTQAKEAKPMKLYTPNWKHGYTWADNNVEQPTVECLCVDSSNRMAAKLHWRDERVTAAIFDACGYQVGTSGGDAYRLLNKPAAILDQRTVISLESNLMGADYYDATFRRIFKDFFDGAKAGGHRAFNVTFRAVD